MGGRGASTPYGNGRDRDKNGKFYDLTSKYKGMPLHDFENKIRNRKHEYIGLADENGNIIIAGTSYNKKHVIVPEDHPEFNNARILTHNHPYGSTRPLGATFSTADIINHAALSGIIKETRAVSGGKGENTYIIKAGKGKQNSKALYKYASKLKKNDTMNKIQRESIKKAESKFAKQGKKLSIAQKNQIGLGSLKRVWKDSRISKYGYEYVEVKKARW